MDENIDFFTYKNNFKLNKNIKSKLIYGDTKYDETPLVSIVIPTYKRPYFLKQAIDSALNQEGFNNYEVIVVDNKAVDISNKTTKTEQLISSYNSSNLFYYKNEQNLGMTGNWNRCIELARGKWITILHDDDYLTNDYLCKIHKYMDKADLIAPQKLIYRDKEKGKHKSLNKLKLWKFNKLKKWDFFWSNPISAPVGVIFKKNKAIKIGGFNPDNYPSADYIFWFKYCNEFSGIIINYKLSVYRILVNESLNRDTIIGFILTDHYWRTKFINKFKSKYISNYFSEKILNIILSYNIQHFQNLYNLKFNKTIEKKLNKKIKMRKIDKILYRFFLKMHQVKKNINGFINSYLINQ